MLQYINVITEKSCILILLPHCQIGLYQLQLVRAPHIQLYAQSVKLHGVDSNHPIHMTTVTDIWGLIYRVAT